MSDKELMEAWLQSRSASPECDCPFCEEMKKAFARRSEVAFSLMVKPNSDVCALDCSYCYYKGSQKGIASAMSTNEVVALIKAYRMASAVESYVWHGGEPMISELDLVLLGRAVEAQGDDAQNAIQTSGTLLANGSQTTAVRALELLHGKGNWVVGLSHDGPTNESRGIATEALDGVAQLLVGERIPLSLSCVVSEENVDKPREVMRHFNDALFNGAPVEFILAKGSTVNGSQFAAFLMEALAESGDGGARITNFFSARKAWRGTHVSCTTLEECGTYMVVEGDGSLYPCDHFVRSEWRLGKLSLGERDQDQVLIDAFVGETMQKFRGLKTTPHAACESCQVRAACGRGCPADRQPSDALSSQCNTHTMLGYTTLPPGKQLPVGANNKQEA